MVVISVACAYVAPQAAGESSVLEGATQEQYRQQQFDLLAEGVRKALDMDALYAAMGLARKEQL